MTTYRSFNIGSQNVNGFEVIISRVQSAQQTGSNVRLAAKYFGEVITPSGEVIDLGATGKTSPQIKQIIGLISSSRNGRKDSKLQELHNAKKAVEAVGMDIAVAEIDALIAAREAEIAAEQEAQRVEQEAQREAKKAAKKQEKEEAAAAKKELKKLQAAKKALEAVGMDTTDIDEKIASLQ